MLSERDRMSLLEIEGHLRTEDDEFVRAFEILERVAGSGRRSTGHIAHRPAVAERPLMHAVRVTMTVVALVSMFLLGLAVLTGSGGVAALMVTLGGTVGVMLFLAVSAARSRPS